MIKQDHTSGSWLLLGVFFSPEEGGINSLRSVNLYVTLRHMRWYPSILNDLLSASGYRLVAGSCERNMKLRVQ
jgi:hypothetical protein